MSEIATAEVLVVDHDRKAGRGVVAFLQERGYDAEWVNGGEKAFNRLDSRLFDVLVAGLTVKEGGGMRLMAVARERNPDICVVLIAEESEIELATEAMHQGAADFQVRPLNLAKLEAVIQHGLAHKRLVHEQVELRRRLDERFGLANLVGRSRQMVHIYNAVRQIGPTDEPVLVTGEPGTGKDLIAQALHDRSPRQNEPFVKLDCAGLPETVLDAELFGQAGEGLSRPGRFELADGGTLFLERVGELTPRVQERVFAFLQQGRYAREGDGKPISVDVRLISATNQPLGAMAEAGLFREDLWKRLSSVTIEAPPLRARREDIPLIIQRLLERHGKSAEGLTRNAVNLLVRYDWPGNVRELENVVEGMAAMARGEGPLGVTDVPEHVRRSAAPEVGEIRVQTGATMREIERIAIEETMKVTGYNKEKCAKTLGIGLRTLYRKLKEYGIR